MTETNSSRRATRQGDDAESRVEHHGAVWRIRSLHLARQILAARDATTQAGFTAEAIPKGYLRHHPILISDGPLHDDQRRKVGRFFAPRVVAERYGDDMCRTAARLLDEAARRGCCRLDQIALEYTVEITRRAIGLEHSSVAGMSRRLEAFFRQPPFDITAPKLGRSKRQWALAAWNGLLPVLRFWFADVRPAIHALRKSPRQNVISHLIAEGYGNTDILVECVTYGTAGMVTTREFLTMACWHLLDDDPLRNRYLLAEREERHAILEEIIRLEPVVGHLYRRVRSELTICEDDHEWMLRPGDLVDVCVRAANADKADVGENPLLICPGRDMRHGVDPAGLSFSHGPHKCPGHALAIAEADAFLTDLLRRGPTLVTAPRLDWDDLVTGYTLRGMILGMSSQT